MALGLGCEHSGGIKEHGNIQGSFKTEAGEVDFQIAIDKNGTIGIDWGLYGIPETYVVDKNGIIKYKYVGPITKKTYKKFYSLIKEIK